MRRVFITNGEFSSTCSMYGAFSIRYTSKLSNFLRSRLRRSLRIIHFKDVPSKMDVRESVRLVVSKMQRAFIPNVDFSCTWSIFNLEHFQYTVKFYSLVPSGLGMHDIFLGVYHPKWFVVSLLVVSKMRRVFITNADFSSPHIAF